VIALFIEKEVLFDVVSVSTSIEIFL